MSDTNENKARITEIRRRANTNLIHDMELPASEQKMLELLRVDTLMRSMRFFVEDENAKMGSNDYDKALHDFIIAYRGSSSLIYKDNQEEAYENIVKELRENIKISEDFSSYENIKSIMDCIPETVSQISDINRISSSIRDYEQEIKDLGSAQKGRSATVKGDKDKEAEEILGKLMEKYKQKDKSAKILQFVYGKDMITAKIYLKKSEMTAMLSGKIFEPLDTPEGIARLNSVLNQQYQKTAGKAEKKADNEKIKDNKKEIEAHIEQEKRNLIKTQQKLSKTIKEYVDKIPAKELLGAFAIRTNRDVEVNDILSNCSNFDELKGVLVKSFKDENKIWNYVKDANYYDMVKDTVRAGYDKNSLVYKAIPDQLKNLMEVREMELYGLKNPDAKSIEEMNVFLSKHNYKVNMLKMNISKEEKTEEYAGKSGAKIAEMVLDKAQKSEEPGQLTPYNRRYMTLGLMYCIGEGKEKNNDDDLFKKYMQVYFDKKGFTPLDAIKLKEEYGWEEFKNKNADLAKETYQEIKEIYGWEKFKHNNNKGAKGVYRELKDNAANADIMKEGLLSGIWSDPGISTVHHNIPRRFSPFMKDPNEINNQSNLTVTVQWKSWQEDNHQLEHFFNMSQHDGVLSYLTKEKGEYVRKGDAGSLSEVYYEKPQVKKDGKWEDLIPDNTLLITPNVTIAAPELPNNTKHLALDCFKPLSIVENSDNARNIVKENKKVLSYQ